MKKKSAYQTRTIIQWFFAIFISAAFLFCLTLIPLFIYLQNTFTNLQLEKNRQQLVSGSSQIESVATGMLNVSHALSSDPRFIPLRYEKADYSAIPANIRNQLGSTFSNLVFPLESISHTALLLDQNVVITNETVFFEDIPCYYPDFFSVNDFTYTEWLQLLADNGSGFLPVCHIKTYTTEYDALIFSTKWTHSAYLYACINTADLKKLFLPSEEQSTCYISIASSSGELLYSDLPATETDYQTLSIDTSAGNLSISIHIPNYIFYQKMQPLYAFLLAYICLCIAILIIISFLGTKFSSKPVLNIVHLLEHSKNIPHSGDTTVPNTQHPVQKQPNSFEYIYNSIRRADQHLEEYQNALLTQQRILQARFLEKAINNQLISDNDIQQFHTYFPAFPEHYRLLLFRLWTYAEDGAVLYKDPLMLLQSYLSLEIPNVYHQQLNDTEILVLISDTDFDCHQKKLDFLVENINREEPSYFARGVASGIYQSPENLSAAYHQIQDIDQLTLHGDPTHVYTILDCQETFTIPVSLGDLMTLYTSITYGNREKSMSMLSRYSNALHITQNTSRERHVHEMIHTILTQIRLEHPQQLIGQQVPAYRSGISLYDQLAGTVSTFCELLTENNKTDIDPFTKELFQYIDTHYTDCELCVTSLESHFKCSESTIRKAFKSVTDVTVSRYIEQKRMRRANELLAQNQMTVAEISSACGFSSPNSFYKAYKRIYGHAPTETKEP